MAELNQGYDIEHSRARLLQMPVASENQRLAVEALRPWVERIAVSESEGQASCYQATRGVAVAYLIETLNRAVGALDHQVAALSRALNADGLEGHRALRAALGDLVLTLQQLLDAERASRCRNAKDGEDPGRALAQRVVYTVLRDIRHFLQAVIAAVEVPDADTPQRITLALTDTPDWRALRQWQSDRRHAGARERAAKPSADSGSRFWVGALVGVLLGWLFFGCVGSG